MTSPNAPRVEFTALAETDLDAILDIELEAYPEPWSREMFREEIRNNRSYFYVMQLNGELAGYGGFWLVLDEAHITSVTVRTDLRGQGLGRTLTRHLLDAAKEAGAHIATLEVRESNMRAQNLYKTFGFRQIGRRKGYYSKSGEDAIVMLLELGPDESSAQDMSGEAGA
ncbi:MAG TPA: ribosomal protein S18-alanine N-acetyltransferase [Candidatus Hydrogenedentes bacterium]|jgi:ribosomal-protein-alanine N-acetyltransferase|nr:ribosomal protein S18-alanine N-acetyltransferase [Candidatus Hydrogenedentota bacterium]HPJ99931.1 ribosomal protein S18-alanine N-acetyltransferase [Candidatus Hydrogenedentota bacterium]